MADIIRVGRVSSIDYIKGMISVFYEDKTAAVTAIMPTLANGEYRMPGIGEMVVVAHLSNGTSEGIVLGTIWNDIQVSEFTGQGTYSKQLVDTCYVKAGDGDIAFSISEGSVSVKQMISLLNRVNELERKVSQLGG